MYSSSNFSIIQEENFMDYLENKPSRNLMGAYANIYGSPKYPNIFGLMRFYQTAYGVWIEADLSNLPPNGSGFYGLHIHEKGNCYNSDTGDYFSGTGGHYNPQNTAHPLHAGDMPVLMSTMHGQAKLQFLTDRFTIRDITSRSVIIHFMPDDYRSQPSGESGERIACGVISAM